MVQECADVMVRYTQSKRDRNHKEIESILLRCGMSVADTSALGKGFPDLVVAMNGQTFLVEIKDGALPPSARKLTPDEQKFHDAWKGKIIIICDVDEAVCFALDVRGGKRYADEK